MIPPKVPRLGPAPDADGRLQWKSRIADDGSPLEYSWKWNTTTSKPDVRYSWEPFQPGLSSASSVTEKHAVSLGYMHLMPSVVPYVDFSWTRYFLAELERGGIEQRALKMFHAVDFHRSKQFGLKSYFLSRSLKVREDGDDDGTLEEWDAAILKLDPSNIGRRMVMDFLKTNAEGRLLTPM